MPNTYLQSVKLQLEYYKSLGEKTMQPLAEEDLFWQFNPESNSMATIVRHLAGNMHSRFTDFLTTDGEKPDRNRDAEFENQSFSKDTILAIWESGWQVVFNTLDSLTEEDLNKIVYIRNVGQTVTEALNRQLAHYPYHIGQMVYIGKMLLDKDWVSLSIPKGNSNSFNAEMFSKPKE